MMKMNRKAICQKIKKISQQYLQQEIDGDYYAKLAESFIMMNLKSVPDSGVELRRYK